MKKTLLLLISIACWAAAPGKVNDPAYSDKQLVGLFALLRDADGYAYRITVASRLADADSTKGHMELTNYQSRERFVIYSRSEEALVLLCAKGQFRVNYRERVIYYKLYGQDSTGAALKEAMLQAAMVPGFDSLFLSGASIADYREDKGRISYRLEYPPSSMIRSLSVSFVKGAFFDRISYTVRRAVPAPATAATGPELLQVVTMSGYARKMPEELQEILAASDALYPYLEAHYPGYKLINL